MRLKLEIGPVAAVATGLAERVRAELPTHDGLASAATALAAAAQQADRIARAMNRPWSLHRLPAFFLAAAVLCLVAWVYWRFLHVATLSLALHNRAGTRMRDVQSGRLGRVARNGAHGVGGESWLVAGGDVKRRFGIRRWTPTRPGSCGAVFGMGRTAGCAERLLPFSRPLYARPAVRSQ